MGAIDKDVTEEKYGLEVAEVAKRHLSRAVHALATLSAQASQLRLAQTGKVQGFAHTVKLLSNLIEQEKAKAAEAAIDPLLDVASADRGRPGAVNIKAQRLAEAATEEASVEGASTPASQPIPMEEQQDVAAVVSFPPKRRGGRTKRAGNP